MRLYKFRAERQKRILSLLKRGTVAVMLIPLMTVTSSCSLDLEKAGIEKSVAAAAKQAGVEVYEVKKGSISATVTGLGVLVPSKTTSLYFKDVSGPLSRLYVNLNDQIKAGAVVAEILPDDLQYRIGQQELTVQKVKIRLGQIDDDIVNLKKSIESAQIDYTRIQQKGESYPENSATAIRKAQLSLEQINVQLSSSEKSKILAELDLKSIEEQQQGLTVEKAQLRLQQINNDIESLKYSIELEQMSQNKLEQLISQNPTIENQDNHKRSSLRLEQLRLQLNSAEKSKRMAEIDLKTSEGKLNELTLEKAKIRLQQASDQIDSVYKSLEAAQLAYNQTVQANIEQANLNADDFQKAQIRMDQLRTQLRSTEKGRLLAEIDLKSAELTLKDLKSRLENSKLTAPMSGVVTFVEKIAETELISGGKTIAKIADPKNIVFQMAAADGRYVQAIKNATLILGQEKYQVDGYVPQPGDHLEVQTSDPKLQNRFYLSFTGKTPGTKIGETVEAKLEIKKSDALLIPKSSVRESNGKATVDILSGNEIKSVEIIRGLEQGQLVEVVRGLEAGDKVVLR